MTQPQITRRGLMAGAATLPAIAATPAFAAGHAAAKPIHRTFRRGSFEVTTLLAGSRLVDEGIQNIFGMNVSPEDFAEASAANFIPADRSQFYFTPTVVRTGSELVLFDTGLNASPMKAALAEAGIAPEDITLVILTHMHGDHIGGMTDDSGALAYPNARYVAGQVEYDHWAGTDNKGFAAKVKPFAEQFTFIGPGESPVSGITSVDAFGHTPGHMAYMVEDGGAGVLLMADTANHYVWSLAYPDWEVRFDIDKAAAAATRKRILDMVAADRIPLIGYHMPFPGVGFVTAEQGDRFRYIPATYQLDL
ncbi:MAG: MBL fold metallo-hydrolase [Silicimonas sp.]|nr:MBL fold metallo-hydrolase [Silicimonas sp.]